MLQQVMSPSSNEELTSQDNFTERFNLLYQIIHNMQNDFIITKGHEFIQALPLQEGFVDLWGAIKGEGVMSMRSVQIFRSISSENKSLWLVKLLVDKILQCNYIEVIEKKILLHTLQYCLYYH